MISIWTKKGILSMMDNVQVAADECKHCTDSDDGMPIKGKHINTLKNEDKIYRCSGCKRMWGVDKYGDRIDG